MEEYVANVSIVQMLLDGLRAKITAPIEWLEISHDDCVWGMLDSESPNSGFVGLKAKIWVNVM